MCTNTDDIHRISFKFVPLINTNNRLPIRFFLSTKLMILVILILFNIVDAGLEKFCVKSHSFYWILQNISVAFYYL